MASIGVWARRILALVCTAMLAATLITPWWQLGLSAGAQQGHLDVLPYVIRSVPPGTMQAVVQAGAWQAGSTTSTREMPFHTAALIISLTLCVLGAALAGAKAAGVLGAAGGLVLVDAYWFLKRIRHIANVVYHIPVEGKTQMNQPLGMVYVDTKLMPGLYLAVAAGALALVAALLAFALRRSRRQGAS